MLLKNPTFVRVLHIVSHTGIFLSSPPTHSHADIKELLMLNRMAAPIHTGVPVSLLSDSCVITADILNLFFLNKAKKQQQ